MLFRSDTHRDLSVNADFSQQTFKHVLVPVWLLAYTYGSQSYQVVVNGYTGSIAGRYPKSWAKITLLVLAILAVIGTLLFLTNRSSNKPGTHSDDVPQRFLDLNFTH